MFSLSQKQCTKCGEWKDKTEYHKNSKAKDGLFHWCKPCSRNRALDWYKNNIEQARERSLNYQRSHKRPYTDEDRERSKKYRLENKDRISKQRKEYRTKNADKRRAADKAWSAKNRIKRRINNILYRLRHKDEINERTRNRYQQDPERFLKNNRKWLKNNPGKVIEYAENRRALIAKAVGQITAAEIEALRVKQNYTCLRCGRREPEIKLTHDHVKPISMGGENTIANSQMLCKSCNSSKGKKWIDYR